MRRLEKLSILDIIRKQRHKTEYTIFSVSMHPEKRPDCMQNEMVHTFFLGIPAMERQTKLFLHEFKIHEAKWKNPNFELTADDERDYSTEFAVEEISLEIVCFLFGSWRKASQKREHRFTNIQNTKPDTDPALDEQII